MHLLRYRELQVVATALTALVALGACSDQAGSTQAHVLVRAVQLDPPLPTGGRIIGYRVENLGTVPVYIVACGEQLVADLEQRAVATPAWVPADAGVWCPADQLYLPVALAPDAAGEGHITAPGAGTYRLRVRYRIERPTGPSEEATSAGIVIP